LTRLIRSLALMTVIKNLGRHSPGLTLGRGGSEREIDDGGQSVTGAAWDGGGGSSGEREGSAREVRGEAASNAGLFIGA
jgi:hypothetical protein